MGPDIVDMDGKAMKSGINAAKPVIPTGSNWNGVTPGLDTSPPAVAPIFAYPRACAITGPIYRYDGDLNSSIKMPPHFNRKWFVTEIYLIALESSEGRRAVKAFRR